MRREKGWFKVEGVRPNGDRTLEEQMMGLAPALALARGKSVLDLGCAEGLIARQFALAGARDVLGVELLTTHILVAEEACKDAPQTRFIVSELSKYIDLRPQPEQFDLVLALGIAHKLADPGKLIRFAARSAREWMMFRAPARSAEGWVKSKFGDGQCHVPTIMAEEGFAERETIKGVRGESVQYWQRSAA